MTSSVDFPRNCGARAARLPDPCHLRQIGPEDGHVVGDVWMGDVDRQLAIDKRIAVVVRVEPLDQVGRVFPETVPPDRGSHVGAVVERGRVDLGGALEE